MVLAVLWCYLVILIMVLSYIMVQSRLMVFTVLPYYGVNLCYGDGL